MNKVLLFLASLATLSMPVACVKHTATMPAKDYAHIVNPMIGTDFTGNTYPGAQAPFGMVQLSPDNGTGGWDRIAGYFYPDSTIAGFSHTHLSGTGAGDLYDISFMPVTLPYKEAKGELGIYSTFSHDDEKASAGYYQVRLTDYDINVELTATSRCGVQRYTFPEGRSAVVLNLQKAMNWDKTLDSYIEVVDSCHIRGYRYSSGWAPDQKVYFATSFSRPFASHSEAVEAIADTKGNGSKAFFYFDTAKGDTLVVKTALSAVDMQGAEANLRAEVEGKSFDECVAATQGRWNELLGRVKVEMDSDDDEAVFYTAMYHAMIAPTLYGDADGRYRGADKQIRKAEGWNNYSTFSLWDTYRAAHPLYNLVLPDYSKDMMESLMAFAEQNGRLPVWNFAACETDMMIGYHSAEVLAEAYVKGVITDGAKALALAKKTATMTDYRGLGDYQQLGYVPCDKEGESVSKTLEYAYDDYAIGVLAKAVGDEADAKEYGKRGDYGFNLWNDEYKFFCPKSADGKWKPGFVATAYTKDYTESNAWQYVWNTPHNMKRFVEALGGRDSLEKKLDDMFTIESPKEELPIFSTGMLGQYAHGNEPSHHVAYLYNYTDAPEKGEKLVRKIMKELYLNVPAGLCGNEDCGQMSAWYVFSALGFYPVDPVSGMYEIGSPLVRKAQLTFGDKVLTIEKIGDPDATHVKKVTLGGKEITDRRLSHADLVKGGTLTFEME